MNGWDEASKLLWLKVRLTGQAHTAFKQLSDTTRATYDTCKKGRFEPACKQHLYIAEFQARRKRRDEDWPCYAENLKILDENCRRKPQSS